MATRVSKSAASSGAGSVGGIFVRFSGDSSNLLREINRSTTAMAAAKKSITASAGVMATAVGAAFTTISIASVREFGRFQSELIRSQAIMGDLSESTKREMGTVARTLATELPISAAKAAESFFFLASAGMSAQEAIAAVDEVAKFSVAGQFDMATATDLATDAQSALGMTIRDDVQKNTENMVRVTDTLVEANTLANATVRQFSEALTNEAAAAMKSWNVDIEEGAGWLAVYADQGVKGNRAGAALARTIRLLTSAQSNNSEAFKEMEVEIFDATTGQLDLGLAIETVTDAILKVPPNMRSAAMETLGFQAKLQGVLFPLLDNAAAARGYTDAMKDLQNTTEEIANKQLEAFDAQMKILRGRVNELFLAIGESLMPIVLALNETLKDGALSAGGMQKAPALGFVGNIVETLAWALANVSGLLVLTFQTATAEVRKFVTLAHDVTVALNIPDTVLGFDLRMADGLQHMIEGMEETEKKSKELREAIAQLTPSTRDGQFSNKLLEELDEFERKLKNRDPIEVQIEMAKASIPEVKGGVEGLSEEAIQNALDAQEVGNGGKKSDAEKRREAKDKTLFDLAQQQREDEKRKIANVLGRGQSEMMRGPRGMGAGFGQDAFDQIGREIGSAKDKIEELKNLSNLKVKMTEEELEKRKQLQEHYNEEIVRLERERAAVQMENGAQLFGSLAEMTTFNIASAIIQIQGAMAKALNTPFPANLGAIATVASAAAGIVSTIQSTALEIKGSKRFGGPVRGGEAVMVGEVGRELFVPDADGSIIPNDQLQSRGGGDVKVEVHNYGNQNDIQVEESREGDDKKIRIIVGETKKQIAADIAKGGGEVPSAMEGAYGLQRGKRR